MSIKRPNHAICRGDICTRCWDQAGVGEVTAPAWPAHTRVEQRLRMFAGPSKHQYGYQSVRRSAGQASSDAFADCKCCWRLQVGPPRQGTGQSCSGRQARDRGELTVTRQTSSSHAHMYACSHANKMHACKSLPYRTHTRTQTGAHATTHTLCSLPTRGPDTKLSAHTCTTRPDAATKELRGMCLECRSVWSHAPLASCCAACRRAWPA